jgi:hypothetical protein
MLEIPMSDAILPFAKDPFPVQVTLVTYLAFKNSYGSGLGPASFEAAKGSITTGGHYPEVYIVEAGDGQVGRR